MAVAERDAVGYVTEAAASSPTAAIWKKGRLRALGAGIAFFLDQSGAAVGDDRSTLLTVGRPTIWRNGIARNLKIAPGSALAIRNDTIVGSVSGRAFVYRNMQIHYLDERQNRKIKATVAFALTSSFSVLALGYTGTALSLLWFH